jgi:hypothetical protein
MGVRFPLLAPLITFICNSLRGMSSMGRTNRIHAVQIGYKAYPYYFQWFES